MLQIAESSSAAALVLYKIETVHFLNTDDLGTLRR